MDRAPAPITPAAARLLPIPAGQRSAPVFVDGDVELKFYAPQGADRQTPHDRDEAYVVASGTARFRCDDALTAIGPGDLVFAAAYDVHRFEDFSQDFTVWVLFYGPVKPSPAA